VFAIAGVREGMHVVDAGCGRGELTYASASAGATVDAVDYSESAIELAQNCFVDNPELSSRVRFHCADISTFNIAQPNGIADGVDRVVASDLIEHLSPIELDNFYANVAGGLAESGQFVIHTFPNEWYYRYGYEARRRALRDLGGYLSPEPRTFYEQLMHINEQSPRVLRDQLSRYFPHVLIWFGNPENPLDSLLRPYHKIDCMNAPSLYAIASHTDIEVERLRREWIQEPLTPESMQTVTIELSEPWPQTSTAGRSDIAVKVTNGGPEAIKSHGPNPVHVSYHWVDSEGAPIVFDGIRTPLPEIPAESERTVSVHVERPAHDGPLILQIGMVQEGVAWFESYSNGHLVELPR